MHLIIVFDNGIELNIATFQSLKLVAAGVIETSTFGNTPVTHRGVRAIMTVERQVIFDFNNPITDSI